MKRIYVQKYETEFVLNVTGEVIRMKRDDEQRPYFEVEERWADQLQVVAMALPEVQRAASSTGTDNGISGEQKPEGIEGQDGQDKDKDPNENDLGDGEIGPWMPGQTEDRATWAMIVKPAIDLIESIESPEHLKALRNGELNHPVFPGGRKTVLQTVEERLKGMGIAID